MSHRHWSWTGTLLLCALVSLGACKSSDKATTKVCELTCTEPSDCSGEDICNDGCCEAPPPVCTTTADCCPGQVCTVSRQCKASAGDCLTDDDCGSSGDLYCINSHCAHKACSPDGSCPEAWQTCFSGACVASTPCSGGCGDGAACVLATGSCYPASSYCGDTSFNVPPGYMAVFPDLANVFEGCDTQKLSCAVAELPPLTVNDMGRHASLDAEAGGTIVAAMYDGTFGDLVIRTFDSKGEILSTQWADGVPEGAPVTAGITGPRGGISEAGDDVGQYTSIKVVQSGANAGLAHIAYYAKSDKALRYITRASDGTLGKPVTIDGGAASGDVGLYADLALFSDGGEMKPAVAYFQRSAGTETVCGNVKGTDGGSTPSRMTALKLARATKAIPASPDDWTVETVACHVMPAPACEDCPLACIQDDAAENGTRCITVTQDCLDESGKKTCNSNQHCVDGACHEKAAYAVPVTNFAMGKGLFPSLAFQDGSSTPFIAWYDSASGNLMLSSKSGSDWTTKLVDGEMTSGEGKTVDTGDVGLYPSLTFDRQKNGAAVLAYYDATRRGLRFLTAADPMALASSNPAEPPDAEFIDRGHAASADSYSPPAQVGADPVLLSTDSGLYAAYQDATASDLVLRGRNPNGRWDELQRWSEGAIGYYNGIALSGGKLWLGTAQIKAASLRDKPRLSNSHHLFSYSPSAQ